MSRRVAARVAAATAGDAEMARRMAASFELEALAASPVAKKKEARSSRPSEPKKPSAKRPRKLQKKAPSAAAAARSSEPKKSAAKRPRSNSKLQKKAPSMAATARAEATDISRRVSMDAAGSDVDAASGAQIRSALVVHFVRHGHVHNPGKLFYGRMRGFHLSATGFKEAKSCAAALSAASVAATPAATTRGTPSTPFTVFFSPQLRTRETAEVLLGALKPASNGASATLALEAALDEVDSPLDGQAAPKGNWANAIYSTTSSRNGAYETFADVAQRVVALLRRLSAAHASGRGSGGDIVCVTHGDVCLAARLVAQHGTSHFLARADALRLSSESDGSTYPGTASVTTLRFPVDGGNPMLV